MFPTRFEIFRKVFGLVLLVPLVVGGLGAAIVCLVLYVPNVGYFTTGLLLGWAFTYHYFTEREVLQLDRMARDYEDPPFICTVCYAPVSQGAEGLKLKGGFVWCVECYDPGVVDRWVGG